jgi:hypothetical protein
MSKDPAFLFYPGNWLGGTMGMTFEEKGCYIELLMMQFNHGKFTEEQAKRVLSICFDNAWPTLKHKFDTDGTYYWNKRMQEEVEKRKNYIESRRCSGLTPKKKEAYASVTLKRTSIINKNSNIIRNKNVIPPKIEWIKKYCEKRNNGIDAEYFFNWYAVRGWKTGNNGNTVVDWEACVRTWENRNEKDKKKESKPQMP